MKSLDGMERLKAKINAAMMEAAEVAENVSLSFSTRQRANSKALAYRRVLDWIDDVEPEEVRIESEKHQSIEDLGVEPNECRGKDDDFNIASLGDRSSQTRKPTEQQDNRPRDLDDSGS